MTTKNMEIHGMFCACNQESCCSSTQSETGSCKMRACRACDAEDDGSSGLAQVTSSQGSKAQELNNVSLLSRLIAERVATKRMVSSSAASQFTGTLQGKGFNWPPIPTAFIPHVHITNQGFSMDGGSLLPVNTEFDKNGAFSAQGFGNSFEASLENGVAITTPSGGLSCGGVDFWNCEGAVSVNNPSNPFFNMSLEVGTDGNAKAGAELDVFGIVTGNVSAWCGPDSCGAELNFDTDLECGEWWLDAARDRLSGSLNLMERPIELAHDTVVIMKAAAATVREFLENTDNVAECAADTIFEGDWEKNMVLSAFTGAPEFIQCLDNDGEGCESTLATIVTPFCEAMLSSSVVETAKQAIAQMRSFGGSCLDNVLPGVLDWTKAVTIGLTAQYTLPLEDKGKVATAVGTRVQAFEIGIAFDFAEDGYHVERTKCYVTGAAGTSKPIGQAVPPPIALDGTMGFAVTTWRQHQVALTSGGGDVRSVVGRRG